MRKKLSLLVAATLLALCVVPGWAFAEKDKTGERLLTVTRGLQMPSSESDSFWQLVFYSDVDELPEAGPFGEMSGCREGGMTRYNFDGTFDRLSKVEPWMDAGQASSARGFRKLAKVFEHEFGEEVATYRCDTGGPEIHWYFVGVEGDRLAGVTTISIET